MESKFESLREYTSYDSLIIPAESLSSVLQELKHQNWTKIVDGIDKLRSFVKFRWDDFYSDLLLVLPCVIENSNSLCLEVRTNTLLLISECLLPNKRGNEVFVKEFLSLLLARSINYTEFTGEIARNSLSHISSHCRSLQTAIELKRFCNDKSVRICKVAFATLEPILKHLDFEDAVNVAIDLIQFNRKYIIKKTARFLNELKARWSKNLKFTDEEIYRLNLIVITDVEKLKSFRKTIEDKRTRN